MYIKAYELSLPLSLLSVLPGCHVVETKSYIPVVSATHPFPIESSVGHGSPLPGKAGPSAESIIIFDVILKPPLNLLSSSAVIPPLLKLLFSITAALLKLLIDIGIDGS